MIITEVAAWLVSHHELLPEAAAGRQRWSVTEVFIITEMLDVFSAVKIWMCLTLLHTALWISRIEQKGSFINASQEIKSDRAASEDTAHSSGVFLLTTLKYNKYYKSAKQA